MLQMSHEEDIENGFGSARGIVFGVLQMPVFVSAYTVYRINKASFKRRETERENARTSSRSRSARESLPELPLTALGCSRLERSYGS